MKKFLLFGILLLSSTFAQVFNWQYTNQESGEIGEFALTFSNSSLYYGNQAANNDSTKNGKSWTQAKATLTEILVVANNLLPRDATNPISINTSDYFTDAGIYTIPGYVRIHAPNANFTNSASWTFGAGSSVIDNSSIGGTVAADDVSFTPTGTIAATDVQAAIVEVNDEAQPLDTDLTAIAALVAADDDVIQRKSGAWTNRTPAQLKTDLAITKTDVGLSDVTNDAQLKRAAGDIISFGQKATISVNDAVLIEDSEDSNNKQYVTVSQITGAAGGESNTLNSYGGGISLVANPSKVGVGLYPKDLIFTDNIDATATTDTTITIGYTGTAPPDIIYKTSDQSVTSSTTLIDDDDFTFAVDTSSSYVIDLHIVTTASGGMSIEPTRPTGTTGYYTYNLIPFGQTSPSIAGSTNLNDNILSGNSGTSNPICGNIRYFITTSTTSGNFTIQWAQASSNATATVMKAGSSMTYTKIN